MQYYTRKELIDSAREFATLPEKQQQALTFMLGKGDISAFRLRDFADVLPQLEHGGYVERDGKRYTLSAHGIAVTLAEPI